MTTEQRIVFVESIAKILQRRDGLNMTDAFQSVEDTLAVVDNLINDGKPWSAESYFCEELGLEPDYIETYIMS